MSLTIAEIAARLGLEYSGDGSREISRVSGWSEADGACLVFWDRADGAAAVQEVFPAGCVVARPGGVPSDWPAILSERPKLDFARAAAILNPPRTGAGVRHETAVVAPTADVSPSVDLGPWVVIGERARVLGGTVLHAGVVVGEDAVIGRNCTLYPRVVLYPGVVLGSNVVLHAGVVVGSDGFGYVPDGVAQVKFPQAGRVIIEDDVEIGANTTIDRGSLGTTRVGAGSKIDNLVQVAHNVEIGRRVVIAAQTGISGSTVVEDDVVIGGQVGFGDHCRVQAGAVIGSKAGILPGKIVRGGNVYWGVPVRPLAEYKRLNALFGRLPEMKEAIAELRRAVDQIQKALETNKP